MRSSENTLIARLGFADPDKKTSRHDLACAFLAQEELQKKLFLSIFAEGLRERFTDAPRLKDLPRGSKFFGDTLKWRLQPKPEEVSTEYFIKGPRQGTVGFVDVRIQGNAVYDCEFAMPPSVNDWEMGGKGTHNHIAVVTWLRNNGFHASEVKPREEGHPSQIQLTGLRVPLVLGVEVKIYNQPVGDAIRQIKFYREHTHADAWALVTDYDVLAIEKETLDRESIYHARLSPEFDVFVRDQTRNLNAPTLTL